MSQPYVGEIRMFGGNFAPVGWMLCQGQTLPISEYDVLFNLIGTTYGGDGTSTFNLPNLQSRFPVHMGNLAGGGVYLIGQLAGVETVTLTTSQIPSHSHSALASTAPNSNDPTGHVPAGDGSSSPEWFAPAPATGPLDPNAIGLSGGSQPHDNVQPFLAVNFIISLFGIYPSQN